MIYINKDFYYVLLLFINLLNCVIHLAHLFKKLHYMYVGNTTTNKSSVLVLLNSTCLTYFIKISYSLFMVFL